MKSLKWVGLAAVIIAVGAAMLTALNMGETSPVFVTGTITVPEEMRGDASGIETLFVIINDEANPMPMPFGAMKERMPIDLSQPIPFFVTKESLRMMNPDAAPPQVMRVKVRIDKDGTAGVDQPGDLTAIVEHVNFGTKDLKITINHRVP
jgi:uncharacterized protein (DUF3820 family)